MCGSPRQGKTDTSIHATARTAVEREVRREVIAIVAGSGHRGFYGSHDILRLGYLTVKVEGREPSGCSALWRVEAGALPNIRLSSASAVILIGRLPVAPSCRRARQKKGGRASGRRGW